MQLMNIETFKSLSKKERNEHRTEVMEELQTLMDDAEAIRTRIANGVVKLVPSLDVYDKDFETLLFYYCTLEQHML